MNTLQKICLIVMAMAAVFLLCLNAAWLFEATKGPTVLAPHVRVAIVDRHTYLLLSKARFDEQHSQYVHDPVCSQCTHGAPLSPAEPGDTEIECPSYVKLQLQGHDFLFIGGRSYAHDPECKKCKAKADQVHPESP